MANGKFDFFIINEAVPIINHVAWPNTHEYANIFYDAALNNNPDTRFLIGQTWSDQIEGADNCDNNIPGNNLIPQIISDRPYWDDIADAVSTAHEKISTPIIPGGEAMLALNSVICAGEIEGVFGIENIFIGGIHLNAEG